jgi:hypothetical protein
MGGEIATEEGRIARHPSGWVALRATERLLVSDPQSHELGPAARVQAFSERSPVARRVERILGDDDAHALREEGIGQRRRGVARELPGGIIGRRSARPEHVMEEVEIDDGDATVSSRQLASKRSRDRALATGDRAVITITMRSV